MDGLDEECCCSICLDRPGQKIVVGCDHLYCERCIAAWCTNHKAQCPICQMPVHGLTTEAKSVVYLSPHEVPGWGITVKPQTVLPDRDVFRLADVSPESIGNANGLCADQFVRFFGAGGQPVSEIEAVKSLAAEAYAKKRLLKVQVVGRADGLIAQCLRRWLCPSSLVPAREKRKVGVQARSVQQG